MTFTEIRYVAPDEVCTLPEPHGSPAMFGRAAPPTAIEDATAFLEERPPQFTLRPSADMPLFFPRWGPRPLKP